MIQSLQRDRAGILLLSVGLAGLIFGLSMGSGPFTVGGALLAAIGMAKLLFPSLRRKLDPYDLKKLEEVEFNAIEKVARTTDGNPMCPRCGEIYSPEFYDCPRCRRL